MTIIFNALNFSPEIVGNGKYTGETVLWLSKRVERIIVITTNPYYPKWKCLNNKYKIETIENVIIFRCPIYIPKKINGFTKILHYLSFLLTSFPIFLYSIKYSPKLLINICPTILSIPNSFFISFINKIIHRKKLFTWIHYQDLEIEAAFNLNIIKGKYPKKVILFIERLMLNQIDVISTISSGMIKRIKNKLRDSKKLLYLPNFIDSHIFEINSCSEIHNPFLEYLDFKNGKKIIMYSGTFNEKISYQTILETIEILKDRKDIFWIFSGEGPREKFFRDKLIGFENCIMTKLQPNDKLPYWINIADIHLIPQKLSVEDLVMPSKLLAILASKKPVIGFAKEGTDLGNILDIAGIRISDENSLTLSREIINLINNSELRTKLGIAGNQYVKLNYDKEIILKKLLNKINYIYSL